MGRSIAIAIVILLIVSAVAYVSYEAITGILPVMQKMNRPMP